MSSDFTFESMDVDGLSNTSQHVQELYGEKSIALFLFFLCFVGIIGDCLNIMIFNQPVFKAVSYIYMSAISIADLLYQFAHLFYSLNLWRPILFATSHEAAWFLTYFVNYLVTSAMDSCNVLMVMVTLERYIATCHYMHYKNYQNHKLAKILSGGIYVISLIFHIPSCFNSMIITRIHNSQIFYEIHDNVNFLSSPGSQAYLWLRNILFRFLPLIIIIVLSIKIIISYKKVQRRRDSLHSSIPDLRNRISKPDGSPSNNTLDLHDCNESSPNVSVLKLHYKGERQIYLILLITAILFFISALFGCMTSILLVYKGSRSGLYFHIRITTIIFQKITYGFSFYFYCIFISNFRKSVQSIFCQFCQSKATPPPSDSSVS